jgi:hypothetical protein
MFIFAHEITKNKIDDEEGLSKQNQGGVGRQAGY